MSMLIPCYNRAHHIGHVIQHVLDQTLSAAEVIVVDDASTDESASIIQAYPVTLIRHGVNQGPAAARNTAN
ncbi:MAG: glycosyltransferase, partial [Anaerolineales bacterium]